MAQKEGVIYYTPIGGTGEIGKNCTLIEYGDEAVMIDCGLSFPDYRMFGVDIVVPDFTYPWSLGGKLKAILITHGHEDHIGALPYFLRKANPKPPIYATRLTRAMIHSKLQEWDLHTEVELIEIAPGEEHWIGPFRVNSYRVTHSIPDSVSYSITTPAGTFFFSGDFKLDPNPIDGHFTEMERIAALGREGVLAAAIDVTRSDRPGTTPSESTVGPALEEVFKGHRGRIFTTTFASNVHRVQQIINVSEKYRRKVAIVGRSMIKNFNIAKSLGYVEAPSGVVVSLDELDKLPDEQVSIIITGSQGEPLSALARVARGEHRDIRLRKGDLVIFSASPIPGNELAIYRVVDRLYEMGSDVIFGDEYGVHVSGHAAQDDLRAFVNLIQPRYILPQHGDYRHQMRFKKLVQQMGWQEEQVAIVKNGQRWEVSATGLRKAGTVPSGAVYIHVESGGDLGARHIEERQELAEAGVLVVSVALDPSRGQIASEIEFAARGFFTEEERPELYRFLSRRVEDLIYRYDHSDPAQREELRLNLEQELRAILRDEYGLEPEIITAINYLTPSHLPKQTAHSSQQSR